MCNFGDVPLTAGTNTITAVGQHGTESVTDFVNWNLSAQNAANVYNDYPAGLTRGIFLRCPGGASTPIAGSNPFYSPAFTGPPVGTVTGTPPSPPSSCDSTDVVPGP